MNALCPTFPTPTPYTIICLLVNKTGRETQARMQRELKTGEREEVKDANQLILQSFKSEKTLAFSDDESMLLTDTSC